MRVQSEHVVRVLDVGNLANGAPFICRGRRMRLLTVPPASAVARAGPVPTPRSRCRARGLCYVHEMRAPDEPDPNDPLAPRADDPLLFGRRWLWMARLYDRPAPGTSRLRTSAVILAMVLVLIVAALGVVLLAQR